jgi:hypothetical protein
MYGYGSGSLRTDVPFAQDAASNRLLPMIINVWNLRFLHGETVTNAPPVIEASLTWGKVDPNDPTSANKIVGTVTNKGAAPLRDIIVRVIKGAAKVEAEQLAPGATLLVDQVLQYSDVAFTTGGIFRINQMTIYGVEEGGAGRDLKANEFPKAGFDWYWSLCDLAAERSQNLDRLMERRSDLAVVYAEAVDPAPAVTITDPTAKQQHWQFVRALVPITIDNGVKR